MYVYLFRYTHLLTFLGIRRGYDRIDNTVYIGILPTIAMQKYLIEHEKIDAVISMNEDYELTYVLLLIKTRIEFKFSF
jgi:hypothetical protein